MSPQQLTWLITGCSSGFGEQLVKAALHRGDKAIATARNIDSIKHLKEIGATILQLDVSAPLEELREKVKAALEVGSIDVVVHNAGSIQFGAVEDLSEQLLLPEIRTNFFGPLNLTKAIMPHFRERKAGRIVHISSATPWTGGPGLGAHAATKAAADALFNTMSAEIQPFGVKTLIIQPGSFRTNIAHPSKYNFPPSEAYKETMDWMRDHLAGLSGTQQGDPSRFAEVVVDLVKGQGYAEGKEVPTKLLIGSDTCTFRKVWRQQEQKTLEEWEPLTGNTNYGAVPYKARERDEAMPEAWDKIHKDVAASGE